MSCLRGERNSSQLLDTCPGPLGILRDNGKENGNYRDYKDYTDYIGVIMGLGFTGYIGIMEKKMESTIMGIIRA